MLPVKQRTGFTPGRDAVCLRLSALVALAVAAASLRALVPDAAAGAETAGLVLHVSPAGNDAWSGTLAEPNAAATDGPFASLERARNEIRKRKQAGRLPEGGVAVWIGGGTYERSTTFELGPDDSGVEKSPIVYQARPGALVRLIGGRRVTGFRPVSDPKALQRLDPAARGHVLQADLKAQGIADYGRPSGGGLELFFQEKPMPVARWPNQGFVKIAQVLGKTPVDVRGTKGCAEGIIAYEGDRPRRWAGESDAWLHGYWFWDWADQRQKVEAVDPEKRTITLAAPHHHYGYRKGQWFYAFNLLSEIDQPGEWYLDRAAGVLYFWPPAPIAEGQAIVSVAPTLVRLNDASHVTIQGLTLEAMRDTAVVVSGGAHVRIAGCSIRNGGRNAASISGRAHAVAGCDVYQMAEGGIALAGGDRKTLAPAGLAAENNHIHDYGRWKPMYSAGISIHGVGNRAAHNLIHHAPHQAIGFGGNDHVIEFNEIHNVCFESNDAGAIYAGRDWTMRGTVIRHNYLHHIYGFEKRGCVGVYLDDMFCGVEISGNVFYQVPRAAFIGGGRDCRVENNIFVDCTPALHIDARALGWAGYHAQMWIKEGREKGTLSGTRFRDPPYRDRYPELPGILEDDPAAPRGNVVARNICWKGRWDEIEAKARPLVAMKDNLVDVDPRFVDAQRLDFRLRDDSPAWKLGFRPIPFEKIGLRRTAAEGRRRPNLLFAIADDWGWPHAGVCGDRVVKTPTVDRLARQGVLFRHAFVAAPTCTASRGAIVTGQAIHRLEEGANLWSLLPKKFTVYPDVLERAGYAVGLQGKGWGPGTIEGTGRTRNPAGPQFKSFDQFLRTVPEEKPFCFWYGSFDPHRPYDRDSGVKSGMKPEDVQVPPFLPDTPTVRRDLLDYYCEVQRFDRDLGRIVEQLEQAGRLADTLIVVTGDNGIPFPRAKATLYDAGTRVPLVVSWPARVPGGRVVDDFVSLTDVAPTFLEAAGLAPLPEMTGRSFLDVLVSGRSGQVDSRRDRAFTERERHCVCRPGEKSYPVRAVRTRDFLYVRNLRPELSPAGDGDYPSVAGLFGDVDGSPTKAELLARRDDPALARFFRLSLGLRPGEELYDLAKDPGQLENVAGRPEYAEAQKRLRGDLDRWMAETGDPRSKGETDFWDRCPYTGGRGPAPPKSPKGTVPFSRLAPRKPGQ